MFLIIQGTSDFHLLLLFSHIQARVSVPHADTATRETHCEHQNNLLLCYLYSLQHGLRTRSTCIFIRPQRPFLSPTLSSSSSSPPSFVPPPLLFHHKKPLLSPGNSLNGSVQQQSQEKHFINIPFGLSKCSLVFPPPLVEMTWVDNALV